MSDISSAAYADFSALVKQRLGIHLGDNKQYLVKSRLSSLMREHKYDAIDHFIHDIVKGVNRELQSKALFAMTTNETFWFRDSYPFNILQAQILPELAKRKKNIRIWSAACSSGQEPYSIAMTLLEYQQSARDKFHSIEILGTDFSEPVLQKAKSAVYDELAIARGLSQERLTRYFTQTTHNRWTLSDNVRQLVTFRPFNLLDSFQSLSQFDVIFCRNVLIYFDEATKFKILQKFSAQLPPAGILLLGAAESIGQAEQFFNMQKHAQGLYYIRR